MVNTQINITKNGTTTLATAGKYCDKNIDVNVDVAAKPTQFTNYYDPANVTIDYRHNCSSAAGLTFTADNETNYIRIHCYHAEREPFALRMRGIGVPRSRFDITFLDADENVITWGQISSFAKEVDEYGDMVIAIPATNSIVNREWYSFWINFQYDGFSSATEALTGPIITINEPIGNGGYAE